MKCRKMGGMSTKQSDMQILSISNDGNQRGKYKVQGEPDSYSYCLFQLV